MKRFIPILLLLAIATVVFSQGDAAAITSEWLDNINNQIYSALVIIFGLISGSVPVLNKYKPLTRVVAFAVALGIAFVSFGASDVVSLLAGYAFSNSIYDNIIKPIKEFSKRGEATE